MPSIDGLRCLAVAGVIAFHGVNFGMPSFFGWAGVWLFFVISGFVITISLMAPDYEDVSLTTKLRVFWYRRALRILPLYLLVILLGFGLTAALSLSRLPLEQAPYLLTFTYNFYRIWPGYEPIPIFSHLWSLSVEEQFYLLYPVAFFALSRRGLRWLLMGIVLLGPVVRYLAGVTATFALGEEWAGNAVYQFSPGHFDAFAAGAMVALYRDRIVGRGYAAILSVIGALAALLAYGVACALARPELGIVHALRSGFVANVFGQFQHVAAYSVLNAVSVACVVLCVVGRGPAETVLRWGPFRHLGRISYGLYIYHLPLIYLFDQVPDLSMLEGPLSDVIYLVALFCVAHLSYFSFERQFLRLKPRAARVGNVDAGH